MKFLIDNWHIFAGVASALPVGSVIGAKLQRAKTKSQELANLETTRKIEKGLMIDMQENIARLTEKNKELTQILDDYERIIRRCKLTCKNAEND